MVSSWTTWPTFRSKLHWWRQNKSSEWKIGTTIGLSRFVSPPASTLMTNFTWTPWTNRTSMQPITRVSRSKWWHLDLPGYFSTLRESCSWNLSSRTRIWCTTECQLCKWSSSFCTWNTRTFFSRSSCRPLDFRLSYSKLWLSCLRGITQCTS